MRIHNPENIVKGKIYTIRADQSPFMELDYKILSVKECSYPFGELRRRFVIKTNRIDTDRRRVIYILAKELPEGRYVFANKWNEVCMIFERD